jgi:hypothetical protein
VEVEGGEGLIVIGDVAINTEVFFAHPDWKFSFDADPDKAVAARKSLLDRAASEKLRLIGFHWLHPGVGFAEKVGTAYRYLPA